MRLRLIQKDVNDHDFKRHLNAVPSGSADIVCFPELATSGCLYNGGEVRDFDEILADLTGYDFSIFIGLARKDKEGLRNSYLYIKDGQYQLYDKINLFPPMNEPDVYVAGDKPGIIDTEFGKFGAAICYDLRFPDLFRQLTAHGVDWIIVPAAFPKVRINDWKELIVQRARETGVHVIGVNAVGDDGVNTFGGASMIAGPGGDIIVEVGCHSEDIVDFDL